MCPDRSRSEFWRLIHWNREGFCLGKEQESESSYKGPFSGWVLMCLGSGQAGNTIRELIHGFAFLLSQKSHYPSCHREALKPSEVFTDIITCRELRYFLMWYRNYLVFRLLQLKAPAWKLDSWGEEEHCPAKSNCRREDEGEKKSLFLCLGKNSWRNCFVWTKLRHLVSQKGKFW